MSCKNCGGQGPGYSSPSEACKGPHEKILFVACPSTKPNEKPDGLVIIDVDPESPNYCKPISTLLFPNHGDEVHHMGWNACSSCFGCRNIQRTHLVFPCLHSSRIYVVNVLDVKNPKVDKIVERKEMDWYDVSFPHTAHCLNTGEIMISCLGDSKGNNKCDFILLDSKTFQVVGTWLDRDTKPESELPKMNYDFWYQPGQNLMISTEWGTPNKVKKGFDPVHLKRGYYGNRIHIYDWRLREHKQTIQFIEGEGWLPFEVRFKHNPKDPNAFFGTALGGGLYHVYKESENSTQMAARLAISIPNKKVSNWALSEMPASIADLVISMDDNFLFFSCYLHGDVRMYDIRDPFNIKLVGQCFIGGSIHNESGIEVEKDAELTEQPDACYVKGRKVEGGPNMIQNSLDGKRLYVTTSLYRPWDNYFYPKLMKTGSVMVMLDVDNDLSHDSTDRLTLNPDFLVDFSDIFGNGVPYLAHEMRYPGGDCTSDIWP
uniref:Methanethiol oxidase n=1 Tax=Panagrolaimus sp. JU765 TaxID=591449 RepID=A0AC34R7N0_9BILA